jgi:hypothetical protein
MRIAPIAGCILATALALAPAAARAEEARQPGHVGTPGHTAEWNAGEVATLADNLAKAVNDARQAARRLPSPGVQSMQQTSWYHFNDQLRLIAGEARQLGKAVRQGHSQADVYPIYGRMWSWIRDAQGTAKSLMIPQDVQAKIQDARAILDQLDAYFD